MCIRDSCEHGYLFLGREQHIEVARLIDLECGIKPPRGIRTVGRHTTDTVDMPSEPTQTQGVRCQHFDEVPSRPESAGGLAGSQA